VSDWAWIDGVPPGPQTARAGEIWTFHLPLEGTGDPPAIVWMELPQGLQVRPSAGHKLAFDFEIPVSLGGSTHGIEFRRGNNELLDRLWLKILPASEGKAAASKRVPTETIRPVEPVPAAMPDPITHQTRPVSDADVEGPGSAAAVPQGIRGEEATNQSRRALDPQMEYVVQVYRGGTALLNLTRPLRSNRSLLIGKLGGLSHGLALPDIDLRHHFKDPEAAAQCSRQQAKVFWSQGQIYLVNTGENAILLPDGRPLNAGEDYSWQLEEELTLPGGLRLRLALGDC